MKFHIGILSIIALILSSLQGIHAQEEKNIEELRSYIEEARQLFEVPGIAVGIIKDGQVIMNEGFGFRNMKAGTPATEQTIFGIASCSKAFTAACMAMVVEDSLVQWDDRVIDHYPEFQLSDPFATSEMRVRDLLCHRSGLQTFDGDLLWYGTDYTREEVVERIRHRDLSYGIRSRFGYQNVMYIAAGELIKKVTGRTWDEFVQERILTPLGMLSTTTSNSGFNGDMNVAYPHVDGETLEFLDYDNSGPAASMNTSSTDLLKWVEMQLNKGTYKEIQVFSKNQYYTMTAPHTLINAGPGETIGGTHFYAYGLGWFMFDYEGRKVIQHGGGLPGFHSKVVLVPEDNLGYVILSNQISGLVESVYKKILDFYLTDADTDWAMIYHENELKSKSRDEAAEAQRNSKRVTDTKPSLQLSSYAGTYQEKMYGEAVIENTEDGLAIVLRPSKKLFFSEMEHWENDTFKITFNDPFLPSGYVTFHADENGGIERFTIDLENPDFHFYKLDFMKID